MPRLDDEHDARHVQHEARNLVFRDRLVQEQEGEQRHEHGVAGKQHADDRCLNARDGQLIQRHAHRDAHQAQQGKRAERFAVELPAAFFQFAHGERNEHQPADYEPAEVELDGVELPGDQLQRDLHAGKQQRRDRDVQIASFHMDSLFFNSCTSGFRCNTVLDACQETTNFRQTKPAPGVGRAPGVCRFVQRGRRPALRSQNTPSA